MLDYRVRADGLFFTCAYTRSVHAPWAVDGGNWHYTFLRSRANSIEGGTTEIQRNILAERVLGLPKD